MASTKKDDVPQYTTQAGIPNDALLTDNIADQLDADTLSDLGTWVVDRYDEDTDSRSGWLESNEKWLKLASQVMERKDTPWENASNTKYPLLTSAATQFHARAMPALFPNNLPISNRVVGPDDDSQKAARAKRVSTYMSYQIMEEQDEWMDEMDRLLFILPISGLCYKKTYYDPNRGKNISELVLPTDLVVNYHATSYDRARLTHRMWLDSNTVVEYQRMGVFRDVDLEEPTSKEHDGVTDESIGLSAPAGTTDKTHELLECHCVYDLDGDGYAEPYIITVDYDSGVVLRVTRRWLQEGYKTDIAGRVLQIKPVEYFTAYMCMPDPNSKTHAMGFGTLLGPTNESINTLINQLTDAGTLSNLQGGFLGKGVRVRGGIMKVRPGEWKQVQSTGDDLRKNIFPLPVKEPSSTLFQLLGLLIQSGERLASISDLMSGENPGQNQPFSTTMTVLEQGLKLFSGVYRRIHRSLASEYRKLYVLNSVFLDTSNYRSVIEARDVGSNELMMDFLGDPTDIRPASDPSIITEAQRLLKAESLLQKMRLGLPINPFMATKLALEAEGHENVELLMQMPEPQPNPEFELEVAKFQHQQQIDYANQSREDIRTQYQALRDQAAAIKTIAQAEGVEVGTQLDQYKALVDNLKAQEDMVNQRIQTMSAAYQADQAAQQNAQPVEGAQSQPA